MVKVLVADENVNQVTECCQYLTNNDQMIKTLCANTGIDTLKKYNQMKADILILDSHFSDINSNEIIDRLSNTFSERKKTNIILAINSNNELLSFDNVVKIYKFFTKPLDYEKVSNTIKIMKNDNNYDILDENYLNKLLFSMKVVVGSYQSEILKEAIIECYNFPYLLSNFDSVLSILSYKYHGMDNESLRTAIRTSLKELNKQKENLLDHPVVKMFEPERNVSPKNFLEIMVSYLHTLKKKE